MKRGLLLVAHGARNPAWAEPFVQLQARLQALQSAPPVHLAYLELMHPEPRQALAAMAQEGVEQVEVLPLFLGGAGHVQRDLAPLLTQAQTELGIGFRLHAAVGEQASIQAALLQLCLQLLEARTAP